MKLELPCGVNIKNFKQTFMLDYDTPFMLDYDTPFMLDYDTPYSKNDVFMNNNGFEVVINDDKKIKVTFDDIYHYNWYLMKVNTGINMNIKLVGITEESELQRIKCYIYRKVNYMVDEYYRNLIFSN